MVSPAPIEPATLLQVDATVIAGVFIFLTILEYTGVKRDHYVEKIETSKKFRHPSRIIIIFAASARVTLMTVYPLAIVLTFAGFAYIIGILILWLYRPERIPY